MEGRRPEPSRGASTRRTPASARALETGPEDDTDERAPPGRGERLVFGAETGVRWAVQAVAVALWVPFGFVFWLPLLLRRTTGYVFAVLYAGLIGGDTDHAARRWKHAVAFYRLGFQRILHALGSDGGLPRGTEEDAERQGGAGRLVLELLWAALVWGTALWLVGIWPDAPQALASAAADAGEGIAELGRRFAAWADGLGRL